MKAIIVNMERHPGGGITARFIKSRYADLSLCDTTLYTEQGIITPEAREQFSSSCVNHNDMNSGLTKLFQSVGTFRGDGYELTSVNLKE